jgi:two-component system, NtrC family, sensor histidine kinase PilS
MAAYDREDNDLYSKIKSLIVARLLIGTTLLMGAAIPLEVSEVYTASRLLFPLVTAILILTILYSGLLNLVENLRVLAYMQLIGDIALAGIVIMATGGIESPFSILFVLTIIIASYIVEKRGAFTIAILASLFFGFVVLSQYRGWSLWWPHKQQAVLLPPPKFAAYIILVNFIGFFLTAFLANNLSERIRKMNLMLKTKNVQFSYLWTLNRRIVNEIHSGLITLTKEGEILSVNPAARLMLKRTIDVNKQPVLDDLFPEYLGQSILRMSEIEHSAKRQITYQFEHDGETVWLLIDVVTLQRMARDPARLMLVLTDISEHKKLEDIKRKAQRWSTVSEISASMAHEIRNPLASISGSIEVLNGQLQLSPGQSKLMDIVVRESDRLNKLITDFLDLAKPRKPEFKLVNIDKVLSEVSMLIETSDTYQKPVEVVIDKNEKSIDIEIDKDQFMQVLWNLVKNALEAMQGGGTLKLSTKLCEEPDTSRGVMDHQPFPPFFRLIVEDTGIGMTPEQIDRIFDPFVTFKRKGVGIGLAIVYRIIENHNANIRVTSRPGKGTQISIDFPMRQPKKRESRMEGEKTY